MIKKKKRGGSRVSRRDGDLPAANAGYYKAKMRIAILK